jgi:aryl-alcohol dehydrogenase-like predicted oxidoreductase
MKYRRLGMWGVRLSEVGLGSWLIFRDGDQEKAAQLHRVAYENGVNFFDTANAYGGGQTEILVGRALAPFPRESFVLATKLYFPVREAPFPGANDRGLSRKQIFERCDISLKRLGTDYIDLYQCHRYDKETPLVETCRAMNDLINRGKALYWGVSEWTADQIAEAVSICDDNGWHRPVSDQPLYNMLERDAEAEVLPTCARLGLGVVNFSPLAEGVLTGKYLEETPTDSRASDEELGQFIRRRMTQGNLAKVRRLKELGDGMGIAPALLAIAWCLRRPEITSAIIGASRPEQLIENVKASELELDDAVMDRINAILGD